jgi:CRP-like cAMP-binding protein
LHSSFNPKVFLGQAGAGKVIREFKKNEEIFAQGEIAGAVFYIQKARSRYYPSTARKPSLGF